jgi:hypothetical protein
LTGFVWKIIHAILQEISTNNFSLFTVWQTENFHLAAATAAATTAFALFTAAVVQND